MTKYLFLPVLLIWSVSVRGQSIEISGRVSDGKGQPLDYASVALQGSLDGTSTDDQGEYSFSTSRKGKLLLLASYIGYETCIEEIIIGENDMYVDLILPQSSTDILEVVITAGSYEASDERNTVVLRSRDIGMTAGATGDITKAIETLPGVQRVGESSGLFVRGGSDAESQVLIDGMVVQKPYYSPVPDVKQRGRFDPFMFSGTVFSTGGYSAQYGQALSSVLALKSKGLADSTHTGGGVHFYGTNMFHEHRWDNTSLYVKGEYNNMAPYNNTIPQLTEWVKSPENVAGTVNFRHKFSDFDMLKFYVNGSRTKMSMMYDNPDSIDYKSLFGIQNDNLIINSSYKKYFKDETWSLYIGGSYSNNLDDADQDGTDMSEFEDLTQGKIVVMNRSIPGLELHAGTEIQLKNADGEIRSANDMEVQIGEIDELYAVVFLEAEWTIAPRLASRFGTRYEYSDFLNRGNIAPRISLAYKTGNHSQVSLAYGKFYQSPENEFLYQTNNLEFENATHLIANYQYMKDKRVFRTELYYKLYQDLISYLPEQITSLNNDGDGYARGVDLFWRDRKSIPNADYWISYSFLDTERDYRDYPIAAPPEFASRHNLSVVYKHTFARLGSMVGVTYAYSSGRPYNNPEKPDSEFHTDYTKAYSNLSFNMSKMLRVFGTSAVIYASVENILGAEHVFGYHYLPNDAGRIPILPSSVRSFFVGFFISTY